MLGQEEEEKEGTRPGEKTEEWKNWVFLVVDNPT